MEKNLIKKCFSAVVAIASCAFLATGTVSVNGCLFEDDTVATPEVEPKPDPVSPVLTLGDLAGASTMEAGKTATWTATLGCTNCTGTTTLSTSVNAKEAGLTATAALEGTTATVSLKATANLCNDTFTVTLTANNAALIKSESKKMIVTGDCLMTTDFTLGAQDNSNPSSLDIDEPKDYGASDAKTNSAKIDLIYAWTFAADTSKIGSAQWADTNLVELGGIPVSSWTTTNNAFMHSVTKAQFDKVKTNADIAALWNAVDGVANSIVIKKDDIIIVKTSAGKFSLLWVKTFTSGEAGQIGIQVKK